MPSEVLQYLHKQRWTILSACYTIGPLVSVPHTYLIHPHNSHEIKYSILLEMKEKNRTLINSPQNAQLTPDEVAIQTQAM